MNSETAHESLITNTVAAVPASGDPRATIQHLPHEILRQILHSLCECDFGPCQCPSVVSGASVSHAFRSILLPYAYRRIHTPLPPAGHDAWDALHSFSPSLRQYVRSITVQDATDKATAHIQSYYPQLRELSLTTQEGSYLILCMGRSRKSDGLKRLHTLAVEGSSSEGPAIDLFDLLGKLSGLRTLILTGISLSIRPLLDERPYLWHEAPITPRPLTNLSLTDCIFSHAILKNIVTTSAATLATVSLKRLLGVSPAEIADALSPVSTTLSSLSTDFASRECSDASGDASMIVAAACTRLRTLSLRDFCLPPKIFTVINNTYIDGTLRELDLDADVDNAASFTPGHLEQILRDSTREKGALRNLEMIRCSNEWMVRDCREVARMAMAAWEKDISLSIIVPVEKEFVWDQEKDDDIQIGWDQYTRRVREPAEDEDYYSRNWDDID